MQRICTSLAQAGFEVWLVGRLMPNSQPFDNQYIRSHRLPVFFNKGKLFYIEYNVRLFFWLMTQRVDIICGIDLDSILPCYFAAKIKNMSLQGTKQLRGPKIKIIYDAHELFSETPEVVRRPLIRKMWLAVERFIVPKVDAAYTVSQSVADEFERRYGRRFDLIRNLPVRELKIKNSKLSTPLNEYTSDNFKLSTPLNKDESDNFKSNTTLNENESDNFNAQLIDNEQFKDSSSLIPHSSLLTPHSSSIILYQGALNEGRGLETAIEAMLSIENAELWLIGEGDLSQILRGSVDRLNLQNKVKFLGFIVPDALPFYTAKATIGLHISEDKGLSYRYSLANKFLDYIQAEVPQVCTQFPEYQRLNEQYGVAVLIEKTDTQLLIAALNRLLNDGGFYQQTKENCRKAATILCWEKEEKRLIELYNGL